MEAFAQKSFLPFSHNLYANLLEDNFQSNCVVSPISIYSGLSLILCGSANETCDDLLNALYLNTDGVEFGTAMAILGGVLKRVFGDDDDRQHRKDLLEADGLFLLSNFNANPSYKRMLADDFDATIYRIDQSHAAQDARRMINNWVARHTQYKIVELMPPGSIDQFTRLVLANAIYFKGLWLNAFDSQATKLKPFYTLNDGEVFAPMMSINRKFEIAHFKKIAAVAVKIPFKAHHMLIVLPDNKNGFTTLLQRLFGSYHTNAFTDLFNSKYYYKRKVIFSMPRFNLGRNSIDLKKPLSEMGLQSIFSQNEADLDRITTREQLYLSKALHQAMIDVNEVGVEAAAATGSGIASFSVPQTINVNRPFVFFVVTDSGIPIIMGHVVNPFEN